ncbi:MAG: V-type ATP synthase subunit I [Prevotellaceae bacterium]|nr:V-type ATP synthase subunit I [Prevotellaceae bacterium]
MKKLTFLVTNTEYDSFIEAVRQLGVVHIEQLKQGATSPELQTAIDTEQRYRNALAALSKAAEAYGAELGGQTELTDTDAAPQEVLQSVESLQEQESTLLHAIDEQEKHLKELTPWGDFEAQAVQTLAEQIGHRIDFFRCTSKYFKAEWETEYFAIKVNEADKRTYFITFADEQPDIPAEHITLPQCSIHQCEQERDTLQQQLKGVRGKLVQTNEAQRRLLEQGRLASLNEISLHKVHLSDERMAGGSLRLLEGWVKANSSAELVAYLDENHIFYEMEDPKFTDDVPVEIREDSYSRLFVPILKMYSLPKYNEIDPTVFFAPFFMLFFGLCLGDGGYGLIVLLVGIAILLKTQGTMRDYGKLAIWLGGATMVCGTAMGTVFGIDLTQQSWAFLAPVKPYFINENGVGKIFGYSPMMVISVILGLIQVLIGMVLKGCKLCKNYGFGYAIGTFSWVVALVSLVALFGLPFCGVALPMAVQYILAALIAVSCVGIFLYNSPGAYKNPITGPLLNLGSGLYSVYGMATGLLGDLLSYIRLFALGLTGGVLGGVFNSLAIDMTNSMPWYVRWLPMLLILLIGHGITFALSLISAFVHPMRLIFVEFFKNANFEGGGRPYQPFKELKS